MLAASPEIDAAQAGGLGRPGRSTLAFLSWAAGTFRSIATMAAGFLATPFILRYLGAERLGGFRAAQQWTGYLTYLYFGLGPALTVLILRPASRGRVQEAASIVKRGLKLEAFQTLLIVMPVGLPLGWFMPALVPVSMPLRHELRIGAILYLLSLVFAPTDMFRVLLECLQYGYLVNIALMIQSFVIFGASVWLAWSGYGIEGQFAALVAGASVFSVLVVAFGLAHVSGFRKLVPARIQDGELRHLRWPMTITGIGGQINLLTDYIVIGLVKDATSVTVFSLTQRLLTIVGGFVTSLTNASWAGLAEILGSGDQIMFQERVLELIRLVVGLGVTILGTLAAYNVHFVHLWVGRKFYGGNLLTLLTAIQVLMLGYFTLFTWTIDSQGDTRYRVPITSFGALLNLALSFFLGRRLGLYGVTLATLIGYSLTEVWFCPYLFCHRYNVSLSAVAKTTLSSLCLTLPWLVLVWPIAQSRSISGWPALGLELGFTFLLALAYSWFVILTGPDRSRWRARCAAAVSRWS
jgi:O-antigen/teichoic acid export membrane protein